MAPGPRPDPGRWVTRMVMLLITPALAACAALGGGPSTNAQRQPGMTTNVTPAASIEELRKRPLRPPPARSSCPTAPTHQDLKPVLATGLAPGKPPAGPDYGYGDGPVYLSGQYDFYPGGWDNAIWLVEPAATGPLLIRGQQLKGSARATFSRQSDEYGKPSGPAPGKPVSTQSAYGMSVPFYSELDLVGAEPPYWGAYFADTHFDAAGCYVIQVDGTTFSELILVEVPDAARPPA